jgi:hypothetical protein
MHFYQQLDDGGVIPRHYTGYAKPRIVGGQEQLRPSTVGDLRKWIKQGQRVAPSVTTIQDVLAKHALINWKIDQHLEQAYELALWTDETHNKDLFIEEVKHRTEIQLDKAPSAGTDFHKLMETFILGHTDTLTTETYNLCSSVTDLIFEKTNIEPEYWQPEVNIFSELGYAGQADLIIDDGETQWCIDYKTKETKEKFKPGKMAYDNHAQQLSAYANEISPKCRCANILVCLETGELDWHEWKDEDLMRGFEVFSRCVEIYYLVNKL